MKHFQDIKCVASLKEAQDHLAPKWAIFDAAWYRVRYRAALLRMLETVPDDAALFAFWCERGAANAHSPNRYFDEMWYRRAFQDVEDGIRMGVFESGFQHYSETGYLGRSGHPLFSEEDYFRFNPDLTPAIIRAQGFVNGYDHYLSVGQQERRVSMCFLSPHTFRSSTYARAFKYDEETGDFDQMIFADKQREVRSSWYFDHEWYVEQYPQVRDLIASGEYFSALHHYLTNETPTHFNPNPYFDEGYYLEHNRDVAERVQARALRNGYDHFVKNGLFEGRSPNAMLQLPTVRRPGFRSQWQDVLNNAFTRYVIQQEQQSQSGQTEPPPSPLPQQLDALLDMRAQTLVPLLARHPLDFRYVGQPEVSVVIDLNTSVLTALSLLTSLHEGWSGKVQLILLASEGRGDLAEIDGYTIGVECITVSSTSLSERFAQALSVLRSETTLLLEGHLTLFAESLTLGLATLARHPSTVAIVPQLVDSDLRVIEAGASVFRDGHFAPYGVGCTAFAPEVNFIRACDGSSAGALLCRTESLRALDLPSDIGSFESRESFWVAISLLLRRARPQEDIVFDPGFLLRANLRSRLIFPAPQQEAARLRQFFFKELQSNLPSLPPVQGFLLKRRGAGPRVVVVSAYQYAETTRFRRIATLCERLAASGAQVAVFFFSDDAEKALERVQGFDPTVEFRCGTLHQFDAFLNQRAHGIDKIWVFGGALLNALVGTFKNRATLLPIDGFVLDIRNLDCAEQFAAMQWRDGEFVVEQDATLKRELDNAWFCQNVVVQDDFQRKLVTESGLAHVRTLGDYVPAKTPRSFSERNDLLISIANASERSHDYQFLRWFMREVISHLDEKSFGDMRLILVHADRETIDFTFATHYDRVAPPIEGNKPFATLASQCRFLVAMNFTPYGDNFILAEAAASGLPAIVGDQMTYAGGISVGSDPLACARAIAETYQDETKWTALSTAARAQAIEGNLIFDHLLGELMGLKVDRAYDA